MVARLQNTFPVADLAAGTFGIIIDLGELILEIFDLFPEPFEFRR